MWEKNKWYLLLLVFIIIVILKIQKSHSWCKMKLLKIMDVSKIIFYKNI